MRLKKIKITGFKTFPETTEFNFDQQLTVIIGPNGSGKSNISDAIKWVLGEQSAKNLRGQTMEDVIFNGTPDRKPLSMAEVHLFIKNEDGALPFEYPEVQITREVFRSGEGRYYINKQKCRLKDITNAFLDTGLGARAYSIIEQGQIEKFISASPTERREIFEEASGIMKYKKRKKEATRNLEKVNDNLVRIEDRILQLEKHARSLKRQASKARRYKRLKDELSELKKRFRIFKYQDLLNKREKIEKDSGSVQTEINTIISNIEDKESRIQEIKLKILEKENKLKEVEGENFELTEKVRNVEREMATIKERLMNLETARTDSQKSIREIQAKLDNYTESLTNARDELNQIDSRTGTTKEDIEESEKVFREVIEELNSKKTMLQEYKDSVFDLLSEKSGIENRVTSLSTQKSQLQVQIDRYRAEINALQSEIEELEKDRDNLKQDKIKSEKEIENINEEIGKFDKELSDRNSESAELRELLENKKANISRLEHQINFLNDLTEHYEGYYEGVRRLFEKINKDQSQFPGIIDVLANLISVDKKYITAIESALGGALQYVVSETMESARDGIDYLKRVKGGRVTFLPIENYDWVRKFERPDSMGQGFLCYADQVVKCDGKYEKIVRKFLQNTIIVDNFDNAKELKRRLVSEKKFQFRLVTLEGEVFYSDGRVSGGKLKEKTAGFLSRRLILQELQDTLAREIPERDSIIKDLNKLENEITKLNEEREFYERQGENARMQIVEINSRFERNKEEQARINNNIEVNNSQIQMLEKEIEDLTKEISGNQEKLTEINSRNQEIEETISKFQAEIEEKEQVLESSRKTIETLKTELTRDLERKDYLSSQIEFFSNLIEDHNNDLEFEKSQIDKSFRNEEENRTRLIDLESEYEKLRKNSIEVTDRIRKFREERSELEADREELEEEKKISSRNLDEIKDRKSAFLNRITEINVKLEDIETRFEEEFGLDFPQEFKQTDLTDFNMEETIEEMENKNRYLSRIGEVNLLAISEFEEVSEQLEIETSNRDDLLGAQENILKVIKKIDHESRVKFMETFENIRLNFQKIFTRLFGEGEADIYLIDEENVLESGIDIYVKPKGKQPKVINLLSGGEKALTAASLVLSIFMIRPSPFCLLDEVDAALDDSNIERFFSLLKEFSDKTQFIIITHNKKTMEYSDAIYGVTMQETGISKIISAKFTDDGSIQDNSGEN